MKPRIVIVGCGTALLALAGCSSGDPAAPPGSSAAGSGHGGGVSQAGSAGQAGSETGEGGGGSSNGGSQATGGSGGGGGSGGEATMDASTTAKDAAGDAGSADAGEWKVLFNGTNLNGWTPSPGATALYAVDQLNGEGVIHVYPTQADQSQQNQATLRTNDSYGSYVYHEEYKWGTKRFADRKQTFRDNGICFHICNDPTQVWPEAIEFQLGSSPFGGDWIAGDIFMLVSKTRAETTSILMGGKQIFAENGTRRKIGAPASYDQGRASAQLNNDTDWNVVELTVHADKDAEYKVNGTVVNRVFNMECNTGGTWKPLDRGPIAVQAEFAEVYFRNIRIKELP